MARRASNRLHIRQSMTTVLVTGGAGFIGSALVRALIAGGHRVVTLDALTYAGSLDNLAEVSANSPHRFVKANIADPCAVGALLAEERPDVIYHLAAESHVDRSIDAPAQFIATNVVGTS